ncbi:MAG: DMT family transporter [Reyranellaceae bacterium]
MSTGAIPARALVLLGVLTLVWGFNWIVVAVALRDLGPWTFRAVSLAVAVAAMLAIARWRGESLFVPKGVRVRLLLAGAFNIAIWNVCTAYTVMLIPSGHAAVIAFSMPLWAAIMGFLFLGERMGPRHLVALGFGVAGIALLMAEDFVLFASAPLGLFLGILAANVWAVGTIVQKRTAWNMPMVAMLFWQLLCGLLPISLGAAIFELPYLATPSLMGIGTAVFVGLVPLAVGMASWLSIVRLLPTHVAALSTVIVPVVAVLSGGWILGEPLGITQYAALACTVVALALVLLVGDRAADKAPVVPE